MNKCRYNQISMQQLMDRNIYNKYKDKEKVREEFKHLVFASQRIGKRGWERNVK